MRRRARRRAHSAVACAVISPCESRARYIRSSKSLIPRAAQHGLTPRPQIRARRRRLTAHRSVLGHWLEDATRASGRRLVAHRSLHCREHTEFDGSPLLPELVLLLCSHFPAVRAGTALAPAPPLLGGPRVGPPTRRRSSVFAAISLVAATALPATMQSAAAPVPVLAASHMAAGRYLVTLADQPIVAYQGGVDGIAATARVKGARVNVAGTNARRYRNHLTRQQNDVAAAVGAGSKTVTPSPRTASPPPCPLLRRLS